MKNISLLIQNSLSFIECTMKENIIFALVSLANKRNLWMRKITKFYGHVYFYNFFCSNPLPHVTLFQVFDLTSSP